MKILKSEKGQSMVEFAIAFIFLLFFLIGIFEFSWIMGNKLLATHASREGARYAAVHYGDGSDWDDLEDDTEDVVVKAMTINTSSSLIKDFNVVSNKDKTVVSSGDGIEVTVSYKVKHLTGFIPGSVVTDPFPINASTTMKKE